MLLIREVAESDVIKGALMSNKLIEKSSLSEDIPLMIIDENVNIKRIQKFFKKCPWAELMKTDQIIERECHLAVFAM